MHLRQHYVLFEETKTSLKFIIPNLKPELGQAVRHGGLRYLQAASDRLTAPTLNQNEENVMAKIKNSTRAMTREGCDTDASTNLTATVTFSMNEYFTDFYSLATCS